jgi:hypothetical protein
MYMNGHGITIFNESKQNTFLDMARHFMIILKFCKTMKKVRENMIVVTLIQI